MDKKYKKLEPAFIQAKCIQCDNKQSSKGKDKHGRTLYRSLCNKCHIKRFNMTEQKNQLTYNCRDPYRIHKKAICERCGFIPEKSCQLDVHHIQVLEV